MDAIRHLEKPERRFRHLQLLWYRFMRLAQADPDPKSDWDDDVLTQIAPKKREGFAQWRRRVEDYFEASGAAVYYWGTIKEAVEELSTSKEEQTSHMRVFAADMRASKRQILAQFAELLDVGKEEAKKPTRRGRLKRDVVLQWVSYAPNGDVDIVALTKAYWIYRTRSKAATKISNEQLWERCVRPLVRKGRRPLVEVEAKRSEVSRHLKRAEEVIKAVRGGAFPFDRPRERTLLSEEYS